MNRSPVPKKVSGKWKHLFICPDRGLFQNLTSLLGEATPGSPFIDLKSYPNRRGLTEVLSSQRPNICFLDVGSSRDSALGVISDLASINPGLPVVAIHKSNDPDLILRCLRQGAREFLFQPFTMEQVVAALERLARILLDANINAKELGKVYCVMPGKGASGATTVACTLAFCLQRLTNGKKTLLADLDPTTGTLSFLLKLKSTFSFLEALAHSPHIDEDIWKGLIMPFQGLDVMLSPETPVEGATEQQDPGPIIDYSRENYGSVVIDTRGPYGEWGMGLARLCDELLVVTTNELPTLHATQKTLAHLERNSVERSKIRLIINRFNPETGLGREAIETALNLEVYSVLPNDYEAVQKSLLEGKPLAASSGLGKSIAHIADKLTGKTGQAKRQSMFSGLFSMFESSKF